MARVRLEGGFLDNLPAQKEESTQKKEPPKQSELPLEKPVVAASNPGWPPPLVEGELSKEQLIEAGRYMADLHQNTIWAHHMRQLADALDAEIKAKR